MRVETGNSPTRYFILSAIVLHELRWRNTLSELVSFRKLLRDSKGLKLREEIHSSEFINKPGDLKRIKRNDRLDILKKCVDWLNSQPQLNVFSVVVDKQGRDDDIFEFAWNTLAMRFENTIRHGNFSDPRNADDRGIVLSDNTEGERLRKLIRRMRHYNRIYHSAGNYGSGTYNVKLNYLIEDPVFRDSHHSFIHQMCDVLAYIVRQKYEPNAYVKKKGGHHFYKRLHQVKTTSVTNKNQDGIVEL